MPENLSHSVNSAKADLLSDSARLITERSLTSQAEAPDLSRTCTNLSSSENSVRPKISRSVLSGFKSSVQSVKPPIPSDANVRMGSAPQSLTPVGNHSVDHETELGLVLRQAEATPVLPLGFYSVSDKNVSPVSETKTESPVVVNSEAISPETGKAFGIHSDKPEQPSESTRQSIATDRSALPTSSIQAGIACSPPGKRKLTFCITRFVKRKKKKIKLKGKSNVTINLSDSPLSESISQSNLSRKDSCHLFLPLSNVAVGPGGDVLLTRSDKQLACSKLLTSLPSPSPEAGSEIPPSPSSEAGSETKVSRRIYLLRNEEADSAVENGSPECS